MGLDMYLLAKRKNQKSVGCTGACGGLFPMSPKTEKEEIGYWRKFYELDTYILEMVCDDDDPNCKEYELSREQIEDILKYSIHRYSELIENDSEDTCWARKAFEDTIHNFNKALAILDADKDNKIYYMCWF